MTKNLLKTFLATLILTFFSCANLFAQRDIQGELKRDIVKIENGVYSIHEFGSITSFDKDYEVEISAKAPVDLLSRDNFVRYYGAFSSSIFSTYFSQEGIKAPDDLVLVKKEKLGNPIDLTVTITMNEKGIDYVIDSGDSKSKMNIQWQYQLFTDPPQRK